MTTLTRVGIQLKTSAETGRPFTCLYAPLEVQGHSFAREDMPQIASNWAAFDGPGRTPIQCDHAPGPAAGWIEDLQAAPTGERTELRATPTWTERGRGLLESGEYRFCSVGMQRDDTTSTGEVIQGWRLLELSLTNVPAVDGLPPIALHRKGNTVRTNPLDRLWAEIRAYRDAHDCSSKEARQAVEAARPDLAQAAGLDRRPRRRRRKDGASHYGDRFFELVAKLRRSDPSLTALAARAEVRRRCPALFKATFSADPRERFVSAVEVEEAGGLSLPKAYDKVAEVLGPDAVAFPALTLRRRA